jgi:hypothetical protein
MNPKQIGFYALLTFLVLACLALVFVPKLCTRTEHPSPYETFGDLVLENTPEWDHAYVTAPWERINVWSYDKGYKCSPDHIVGIVNYAIYENNDGEFLSDFNMRHLSLGHKADPDLVALRELVKELGCTHPCPSSAEIDAWYEGYPIPELSPCAVEYTNGKLLVTQIKQHQP